MLLESGAAMNLSGIGHHLPRTAAYHQHNLPACAGDRLHWVADVVHDEDRSQIRVGSGPASWRANLAITRLRLTG
jgi:hypothetical protein